MWKRLIFSSYLDEIIFFNKLPYSLLRLQLYVVLIFEINLYYLMIFRPTENMVIEGILGRVEWYIFGSDLFFWVRWTRVFNFLLVVIKLVEIKVETHKVNTQPNMIVKQTNKLWKKLEPYYTTCHFTSFILAHVRIFYNRYSATCDDEKRKSYHNYT